MNKVWHIPLTINFLHYLYLKSLTTQGVLVKHHITNFTYGCSPCTTYADEYKILFLLNRSCACFLVCLLSGSATNIHVHDIQTSIEACKLKFIWLIALTNRSHLCNNQFSYFPLPKMVLRLTVSKPHWFHLIYYQLPNDILPENPRRT